MLNALAARATVELMAAGVMPTAIDDTKLNLSGSFTTFWTKFKASTNSDKLVTLLGVVGVVLLVIGVAGYLWKRRRGQGGGGGGTQGLLWTAVVGGLLAAPGFVIPVVLKAVDLIGNAFVSLFSSLLS